MPGGDSPVTLHVDDLDVRKALEMLSREAKVSIAVTPGVSGKVTLDIRNKNFSEALAIIARLCRLTVRCEAEVIYVSTTAEVRQLEEDNLPVHVYHLNYVKSSDVMKMVQPLLSNKGTFTASPDSETGYPGTSANAPSSGGGSGGSSGGGSSGGGGGKGGGGGSKAGGNSLAGGEVVVIRDYEHVLKSVDRVIAEIDVQPTQVMIEAVIVSVKLTNDLDLGVNYAVLDGSGKALGLVGDGSVINAAAGFTPASVVTAAGKVADGFTDADHGIQFGWTGKNITGFISALQQRGDTKVLAAPRIMVLNKQGAVVHLGDNLGYYTSQVSQTSTTQTANFLAIGTQLQLRPFVSSDGMIRMEVHPERSTGAIDSQGIPQTNASEVTTNIMIPDGATIVIGGLIDTQNEKTVEGLPYLMDLPWVGALFRKTTETKCRKELVVILTPHIWRPEKPDSLNYLGRPKTLGLDKIVAQCPRAEAKDGKPLFEMMAPQPEPCPCPPDGQQPAAGRPIVRR